MKPQPTNDSEASRYYDDRYAGGYMVDWPAWKRDRVRAMVRALALPEGGRALDFGCGSGAFSGVLWEALPTWEVIGTDVSALSLRQARERHPKLRFLPPEELRSANIHFDFLFSHHVLEHVPDLEETLRRQAELLRGGALALHILPCGNLGSLEARLCAARRDGVDHERCGRFFFEDEGHLRRLTSAELKAAAEHCGFRVLQQSFANHHAGAIEWMTEQSFPYLWWLTDPSMARGRAEAKFLRKLRRRLLSEHLLRLPALVDRYVATRRNRKWWHHLLKAGARPLRTLSREQEQRLRAAAESEWRRRHRDSRGSEMYVLLQKNEGKG